MDTLSHHFPITINTQRKNSNVKNERRISLNILEETIKRFNGLKIQSIINYSTYYDSEEDNAESDHKSNSLVDTRTSDGNERKITYTDTTNRNSPHKLLTNR